MIEFRRYIFEYVASSFESSARGDDMKRTTPKWRSVAVIQIALDWL
jgi:hypothetical protein